MASIVDPKRLLESLTAQPGENEWLEFKVNDFEPEKCDLEHRCSPMPLRSMEEEPDHLRDGIPMASSGAL